MKILLFVTTDFNETIKVLHPIQEDGQVFFDNEINILKRLNRIFQNKPQELSAENGVFRLIDNGNATWHNVHEMWKLFKCIVIVYTYREPLFPIITRCILYSQ